MQNPLKSSPARMTASATLKLPRWALFLLCLVYILPGLVGRDLWKNDDGTTFGVMWTMAQSNAVRDWMLPNLAGQPVLESGPLMYWVGAACIRLFGGLLGAPMAARLATVLMFLVAVTALWYATYLLGRRKEAQPLALAFGGHPEPRDFGRVLADGALLILLATVGLLQRAHESSPDVAMLAALCVALFGMARALDQPWLGALWIGVGLGCLALTRGLLTDAPILLLWLVLTGLHQGWRTSRVPLLVLTLPLTVLLLAIWPVLAHQSTSEAHGWFAAWAMHWRAFASGIHFDGLRAYANNLPWFTLPAWPLACWALWSWRGHAKAPHIVLPAGLTIAVLATLLLVSDTIEGLALTLLPGLTVLAAFGLVTLRRGGANLIDWFSLLVYSFSAILVWLVWIAIMCGVPGALARDAARQTPGFVQSFEPLGFTIALFMTAGWLWLVWWRIARHPKVLWRSVVLASGGLTLSWALAMTLLLPSINYSKSYRATAMNLSQAEPQLARQGAACVQTDELGLSQRAAFAYFAGVNFAPTDFTGKARSACPYLLRQDMARNLKAVHLPPGNWQLLWEGRRASDQSERYRLYHNSMAATERPANLAPLPKGPGYEHGTNE